MCVFTVYSKQYKFDEVRWGPRNKRKGTETEGGGEKKKERDTDREKLRDRRPDRQTDKKDTKKTTNLLYDSI